VRALGRNSVEEIHVHLAAGDGSKSAGTRH